MKSVVMIAYSFPPNGSAGVYRSLRFTRHLPAMGWSVSVIAADLAPHSWTRHDPTLLALVPNETEVIRVRRRDPWQAIQEWRAHHIQEKLSKWVAKSSVTHLCNYLRNKCLESTQSHCKAKGFSKT
jgi:hypothetical protein